MNTVGLDIDRVKRNVIEYWQAEAWDRPVKVNSAQRGTELGAAAGRLEVEKILGLIPGELKMAPYSFG